MGSIDLDTILIASKIISSSSAHQAVVPTTPLAVRSTARARLTR
ncbi:hypothetical protein ACFYT3_31445 [Nocardia amikacinitolerans]